MLFDGHAGKGSGLVVLILGDPELGGLLRGKSRLPVLTGFLRPGVADCDIRYGHGARLFRLVDHLAV